MGLCLGAVKANWVRELERYAERPEAIEHVLALLDPVEPLRRRTSGACTRPTAASVPCRTRAQTGTGQPSAQSPACPCPFPRRSCEARSWLLGWEKGMQQLLERDRCGEQTTLTALSRLHAYTGRAVQRQ
jgi:hypothetical protein